MQWVREKFYMTEHNITTGGELSRDSVVNMVENNFASPIYSCCTEPLFQFWLNSFTFVAHLPSCGFVITKPASLGIHS